MSGSTTRRLLVLCVVLAGALAAWLLRARATTEESTPEARAEEVLTPAREGAAREQAPERVPVEPTSDGRPSPEENAPADAAAAVLVVCAFDEASGVPLPRVRVSIRAHTPGRSSQTIIEGTRGTLRTIPLSDASGCVEFDLPAGVDFLLWAAGEDESVGTESREVAALSPDERRTLTLALATNDDIVYFGRVLARADRSPIAGASVELLAGKLRAGMLRHEPGTLLAQRATGPDGLFELSAASWKNPHLRIQAPDFAPVFLQIGSEHDTALEAKIVLLSRTATLRVRLLDQGAAITEGAVSLSTRPYHLSVPHLGGYYNPGGSDLSWSANADFSGLCELRDLPPDVPLDVVVSRNRHRLRIGPPSLSLAPGEVREVEWSKDPECRLEGSVIDQHGDTVRNLKIRLQRNDFDGPIFFTEYPGSKEILEARSYSDGSFLFPKVAPGRWWIGPAAVRAERLDPERLVAPRAQVLEILRGASRQEVILRVHRGLFIRGRVLDPDGNPAAQTFVLAQSQSVGGGLTAESESDGTFVLGPLLPGRYLLETHDWNRANGEAVAANGGDEDVVLRLETGGSLAGRVLDGQSGRPCFAMLLASRSDGAMGSAGGGTGVDGAFRFKGLRSGTYDIVATAAGPRVGVLRGVSVQAALETSGLVVTLRPGASLRIKHAGKRGFLRYRILSQGATVVSDSLIAGSTSEDPVPPGRLSVEYQGPGTPYTIEIEVAAGEQKEVVLAQSGK